MSTAVNHEEGVVRPATPAEIEQLEWAQEAVKRAPGLVHESLRQMVTLTTALLAGSTAMLGSLRIDPLCKGAGALSLLLALCAALHGSLPFDRLVDIHRPDLIREERERGARVRLWSLNAASGLLVLAFLMLLFGLLCVPPPPEK